MVDILYGVAGEGYGHAIRAGIILEHIHPKHHLNIVAGGKARHYLKRAYPVRNIHHFRLIYRRGRVSQWGTFLRNALLFPVFVKELFSLLRFIRQKNIRLIITDFEPISCYASLLLGIPCLAVDFPFLNKDVLAQSAKGKSLKEKKDLFLARAVVSLFTPKADYHLVPTFFPLSLQTANTEELPPIIRFPLKPKIKENGCFLVYQTTHTDEGLVSALQHLPYQFIAYGFSHSGKKGNIIFRKFDDGEFMDDFCRSRAIISSGGFSVIAEAIALKKPMLVIPIKGQSERNLNARMMQDLGFGMVVEALTAAAIEDFINRLPIFRKNLEVSERTDYGAFSAVLDKAIARLTKTRKE
ncbi:hypothetical protein HYU14_04200 [Candidatus Woesearchaeota archaeon]|nr:hypothetical protein [Candidatus Woesearchaeota archaeon]